MPLATAPKDAYRPAAGVVIFNQDGRVWLGERKGEKSAYRWQFPQGGIDSGEKPKQAAFRELQEETGLKAKHVKLLGQLDEWLYYDFPPEFSGRKAMKGWRGQRQKWYAVQLVASESKIDLAAHKTVEFSSWKWGRLHEAPELIIPFKRKVYERLAIEFAGYANPVK